MDRRRPGSPVFGGESASQGLSSPVMSPSHHRSTSVSGLTAVKKTQNVAARAAAARLAQVMASQSAAETEEDDDDNDMPSSASSASFRYGARLPSASSNGSGVGTSASAGSLISRTTRSPSPALGRNVVEPSPFIRSTSTGRPSISARTTLLVPSTRPTLRIPPSAPLVESPIDRRRERRFSADIGILNARDSDNQREASTLRDELEMLQEENENIVDRLRLAQQRSEEAEARARELEKQIAVLGEGVSLEARLLSRKEAALRQREAALKAVVQPRDGRDEELTVLRQEVESARDEVAASVGQLKEAEAEAKALRSMTQRMNLTEEEMEEVVLKRCWLARYWGLAVRHGIYPEISPLKQEHWSSLAPLPLEVVISAGQRAKEESLNGGDCDYERRNKLTCELTDITGEGNIESMLLVEKGLRELAALKVEDGVNLAMAQYLRTSFVRLSASDHKSLGDPKVMEAFELNEDESEDVLFKQSWLTYFWRRAKAHGVEEDIAEERLQFWIGRVGLSPTSHDAVDVERGLAELRLLGIEQQLWEASRRDIGHLLVPNKSLAGDGENV